MRDLLLNIYARVFGRVGWIKFNRFLFHASLKGMGILNYQNHHLSGEKGFLQKVLSAKNEQVVFDVGANEGDFAEMVLVNHPDVHLHCFEPHPRTFKRLSSRLNAKSAQLRLVNSGAGQINETLELYDYSGSEGSSHASVHQGVIESAHREKASATEVKIIRLDEYLIKHNIAHIDLLKIDTEGNELNVLKGLGTYLCPEKISAIQFEFNEMNIQSRSTFKDFWDLLNEYTIYRLLPGGQMLHLESYIASECELYAFQNIVAIAE